MPGLIDRLLVVVDASTGAAVKEFDQLQRSAKQTDTSMQGLGLNAQKLGGALKTGLAAAGTALIGGGLAYALDLVVDKFVVAQEAASQFARATNASVEEAGAFTTVASAYGLEMNDLIEINAEFSKKVQAQPELLAKIGVELSKNADGSINMTKTLVSTIDALGNMENGLEAAQIAAELFGEEGSKQLAAFYLAGISVSDLMDRIDFVDQSDQALAFSAATTELGLAMDQLGITVGGAVVPVLTDLVDAGLAVFDFFTNLPGPVVDTATNLALAGGALFAFNKTLAFFKSEKFGALFVGLLDSMKYVPDAFWEAEGAAKKAGVAVKGFGTALGAAAKAAAPLLVLTALFEAFTRHFERGGDVQNFTRDMDNLNLSLEDQAYRLRKTDGVWDTFAEWFSKPFWMDGEKTEDVMDDITRSMVDQAEATLNSADASAAQRQAAQNLLDVIGEGTIEQQRNNLASEEGQAAQRAYVESLTLVEQQALRTQEANKGLAEGLADIVLNGGDAATTWADIASAAADAAAAQSDTKRITELTTIAMGEYSLSLQDAVEWQRRLAGLPKSIEEAKNAIQSSFQVYDEASGKWVRIGDDAKTAGDEGVIAAGNLELAVLDYVDALAAAGKTPLEITADLEALRSSLPADLQYVVDDAIAAVSGTKNDIPIDLTFDVEGVNAQVEDLKGQITAAYADHNYGLAYGLERELALVDPALYPARITEAIKNQDFGLAESLTADYNAWALSTGADLVTITYNADGTAALGVVDDLTGDKSATVNVDAETGDAQADIDGLTGDKSSTLTVNTEFAPGGYEAVKARRDFLMQAGNSVITVDTEFGPGGYSAVKARKDFLLQAKNSTITINVDWEPGSYVDILNRINTVARNRTVTITQVVNQVRGSTVSGSGGTGFALQQQRLRVPEVSNQYSPTNIFRVAIDGQPLRAWIRSEIAAGQPQRQAVA